MLRRSMSVAVAVLLTAAPIAWGADPARAPGPTSSPAPSARPAAPEKN